MLAQPLMMDLLQVQEAEAKPISKVQVIPMNQLEQVPKQQKLEQNLEGEAHSIPQAVTQIQETTELRVQIAEPLELLAAEEAGELLFQVVVVQEGL